MTDWRQIQARIRKAKAGSDAAGQLAELYEKTRDAMVAFELARLHEKAGENAEAARWYTAAAERFRRAQWKTKAQEALARLGGALGAAPEAGPAFVEVAEAAAKVNEPVGEPQQLSVERVAEEVQDVAGAPGRTHGRRRGRRGGRRRRRSKEVQSQPATSQHVPRTLQASADLPPAVPVQRETRVSAPPEMPRADVERVPLPEPLASRAAWPARARTGEPALASRLALLESLLRRLIAGPLYRPDQAQEAPAGPGVFLLSDAEQTAYYYVEACQTLRIGVGNLLRGERGARKGTSLRARFADYLEISESQVSKYLKEHCAVRWVQLDDAAPELAHFAIAVLRPALND